MPGMLGSKQIQRLSTRETRGKGIRPRVVVAAFCLSFALFVPATKLANVSYPRRRLGPLDINPLYSTYDKTWPPDLTQFFSVRFAHFVAPPHGLEAGTWNRKSHPLKVDIKPWVRDAMNLLACDRVSGLRFAFYSTRARSNLQRASSLSAIPFYSRFFDLFF